MIQPSAHTPLMGHPRNALRALKPRFESHTDTVLISFFAPDRIVNLVNAQLWSGQSLWCNREGLKSTACHTVSLAVSDASKLYCISPNKSRFRLRATGNHRPEDANNDSDNNQCGFERELDHGVASRTLHRCTSTRGCTVSTTPRQSTGHGRVLGLKAILIITSHFTFYDDSSNGLCSAAINGNTFHPIRHRYVMSIERRPTSQASVVCPQRAPASEYLHY